MAFEFVSSWLKQLTSFGVSGHDPRPQTSATTTASVSELLVREPRAGVLFADFDGVLHIGNSGTFALLPSLEAVLRKHPEIDIVISSTWRNADLAYLQKLFSTDIAPRVIGVTPEMTGPAAREREIMSVVRQYRIHRWVAIDDNAELFTPNCANLLLTDFKTGLTDVHLQSLDQLFSQWGRSP